MPKNLTIEDKTRTIDPWIDGAVDEFFEFNNNSDISLVFLKKLALSKNPKALLEEDKIFNEAEGVYSFVDAFNDPAKNLLNDSVDGEFNPQIIYLARARLVEAVLKKMREFKNVDINWVIEAQKKISR